MKQIIYKSLFVLCFLLAGIINVHSSSEKYVKTHEELRGFKPYGMTGDGRYIVCNNANGGAKGNTVKLWDTQSNTVTVIGIDCWAYDLSDNANVIVGSFMNPEILDDLGNPKEVHGFYKNGAWHMADYYPGYGLEQGSYGGNIWRISDDGNFMAGYVAVAKLNGPGLYLRPCVWDCNGKFIRIFQVSGPSKHVAAARAISNDGTRVAGFSEIVDGEFIKGIWSPAFWTNLENPLAIPKDVVGGYLEGMNNNGTIAVGHAGHDGIIIKDDGTIIKAGESFMDISETDLVVGKGIYNETLGFWELNDFLKELHGLTVQDANFAEAVSDNGEYICINTSGYMGWGTALVRIAGAPLPTVPNKVILIGGENSSVNISWEASRFNGYNPIGYNVYRDNTKINTELITTLTFKDPNPATGKNCYSVSAVFKYTEDGEELISERTEPKCVEVIGENGCFSPKELVADIEYNRTVNLAWKTPVPNYSSSQSKNSSQELIKIKPNVLKSFGFGYCISLTSDSDRIYGLDVSGRMCAVNKFTFDGTAEGIVSLGMGAYRGIAYNGSKYYTTTGNSILGMNEIKPGCTGTAERINIEWVNGFTRISYLPFLDDNNGGFECGNFKDSYNEGHSYYFKKDFTQIENGGIQPGDATIMGVASYENTVYVAKRESEPSTDMKIFLYDATTNEPTGEYIDLRDYTSLQIGAVDKIWGIHVMNSSENIPCLAVIFGTFQTGTRLAFLELAPMEGLLGYNIYRNGMKINAEPITNSYYTEKIFDANDYEYEITALFNNDCESSKSEPLNITINPIGTVNEPKNIITEAVRNNIIVSWEAPKASVKPKLVGYNIFRNGVKLNKDGEYISDLFYVDKDLPLGEYEYEVNAFYNNSGESAKLSNTINLPGFNPTWPPTELGISQEDRGGVDLTWKAPAMGNYEIKTWHNGNIEDCIGVSKEGGILYVASKWDAKDLSSVFDYTLTDIEFYAGNDLSYTFYIYADDKLVGTQTTNNVNAKDYNLLRLTTPITIEKDKTLMVACKVTHGEGELPIGISKRSDAIGKGDLTSTDGKTWVSVFESEEFTATWAISVRLMPYKLDAPKEIVGIEMEVNSDKNHKIVGGAELTRSKTTTAVFKNSEVTGYNVYKNNEKINTTAISSESFKDTSADLTKNNCYSVEALFTADRKSPKSVEACTFGHCFSPSFAGEIRDDFPSLTLSTPEMIVESNELKFHNGESVNSLGVAGGKPYYALIKYTPAEIETFDRYRITAINAFITDVCTLSLFIKQGDNVILDKAIKTADITIGEMNEFKIDSQIIIDGTKSLIIGLKVKSDKNPIGIDAGPGANYKGDMLSYDAINLISIKESSYGAIDANWVIGATIETSTTLKEKNIGYNIYRDNVKLNENEFVGTTYIDKTAESGKIYTYHATALWDTNCESEASVKVELQVPVGINNLADANIKVYPNPVKEMLNIEGDFETVRFYNYVGQECGRHHSEGGKFSIDVSSWAKGIYVIEITSATGEVNRGKVIIK